MSDAEDHPTISEPQESEQHKEPVAEEKEEKAAKKESQAKKKEEKQVEKKEEKQTDQIEAPAEKKEEKQVEKKEEKQTESPKQQQQTQQQAQPQVQKQPEPEPAPASGGGWGGWFSSKISQASAYVAPVVTTTLNDYVKPTVNTTLSDYIRPAVNSASHMVRDLQQTWDEDQAADDQAKEEKEGEKKDDETHEKEGEEEITEDNENEGEPDEDDEEVSRVDSLLSAMGSSVSTFGTAASFMGSVIQSGITKVQATNMDQMKTMANQVVETTKRATNAVVDQVHERKIYEKTLEAGSTLSHKTFDALESVGKKAMDVLMPTEEGEPQSPGKHESAHTSTSETSPTNKATKNDEDEDDDEEEDEHDDQKFDCTTYFDTCGGNTTLQALAKSSEECTAATQRKMRKIPVADRLALDELFGKIREMAEEEEIEAEVSDELVLGPEFEEIQHTSKTIIKEAGDHFQRLIGELKEALQTDPTPEKATHFSDLVLLAGSKKIVELTIASIEQILCAADLFLEQVKTQEPVNFSEVALEDNQNFPRIVYILKLANAVHAEISQLSNSTLTCLREVATVAKESGSNDVVDKKTSANVNTLSLETSTALSHVQDSKKYIIPVCQTFVFSNQ